MKKLLAALLCLLLLAPSALAQDYEGYLLESGYPLEIRMISDTAFLSTGWDEPDGRLDLPWHVTWWQDRKVFRDLPYYVGGAVSSLHSAKFLVNPDGSF